MFSLELVLFPCNIYSIYRQLDALYLNESITWFYHWVLNLRQIWIFSLSSTSFILVHRYENIKAFSVISAIFYSGYLLYCHYFQWYWLAVCQWLKKEKVNFLSTILHDDDILLLLIPFWSDRIFKVCYTQIH